MRKSLALILALLSVLTLCACGNAETTTADPAAEQQEEVAAEDVSAEEVSAEEAVPEEEPAVSLRAGEKVSLDFVEFELNTAEALNQIPVLAERADVGSYRTTNDNEEFVCVHGTIKNLSNKEIDLKNIQAVITINESNVYNADVSAYLGNSFNTSIAPLVEGKLYIFVKVPADTAENVETCCAEFTFWDMLNAEAENEKELPHKYSIAFSTDAAAENLFTVSKFEPIALQLGDEIVYDFVEMHLDEVQVKDELKEKYNGTTYTYATDTSMKVLCFIGTIKNTSKEEFNPCFTGKVEVDGYEYEIKDWQLCKGLGVSPLVEAPLYIFAEIPESLANSFSSCTLTFGFDDNFNNKFYSDITMLPYVYTLNYNR